MKNCIFCQIAQGQLPSHNIWENPDHLAFLSIFPNTPEFAVVITKAHRPTYVFELDDEEISALMLAAKQAALLLDAAFDDVGRTGCMIEGFGTNHAHVKLFPMHGTTGAWRPINSNVDKYFHKYEGYISSHDHARADDEELKVLAQRVRAIE